MHYYPDILRSNQAGSGDFLYAGVQPIYNGQMSSLVEIEREFT